MVRLWLRQGKAFVSLPNLKEGDSFAIRTDRATAHVTGTSTNTAPAVFGFTSDGVVTVESGVVAVARSDLDLNVTLSARERYDVRTGRIEKLSEKLPCPCIHLYAWPVIVPAPPFWLPERKFDSHPSSE